MGNMGNSLNLCQIQVYSALLIITGLIAVGLSGSQFSSVALGTYTTIDLRLLNWIFVLAGILGFYSTLFDRAHVPAAVLYWICVVIGTATSIFYGFTTYRVAKEYEALKIEAQSNPSHETSTKLASYVGIIVISSVMIVIPALAAFLALLSASNYKILVNKSNPLWTIENRSQTTLLRSARMTLISCSAFKLLLGLGVLGLCAFLEYERELISGRNKYIKIATDHISAMFSIISALVEICAVSGKRTAVFYFKVGILLSIVAAVWALKSVDVGMEPFFHDDLHYYESAAASEEQGLGMMQTGNRVPESAYIIVITQGVLLGCFSILFMLNLLTASFCDRCTQFNAPLETVRLTKTTAAKIRIVGLLVLLCSFLLLALVVLNLVDANWNDEYEGANLLWVAVLLFATGIFTILYVNSKPSAQFVLMVVAFAICLEKLALSINYVYQSVTYPDFNSNSYDSRVGRIVLNSVQLGVLFAASLFTLFGSILLGTTMKNRNYSKSAKCTGSSFFFSLGVLFYGIVMIGSYVLYELDRWRFSGVPLRTPYCRIANGIVAIAAFFVQLFVACYPYLAIPAIFLNSIVAALALFDVSYAMTNTYYLSTMFPVQVSTGSNINAILVIALILAAAGALACVICTFCAVLAAIGLYHKFEREPRSNASTIIAPLEDNYATMRTTQMAPSPNGASSQPYVTTSQPHYIHLPMQQMEEQSVYWSADENPYFYSTSKRYYAQPYEINSGFYGYPYDNPNSNDNYQSGSSRSVAKQTRNGR